MRTTDNLTVGWLQTSIRALIQDSDDVLAQYAFVLITSIDSVSEISKAAIGKTIVRQYADCEFFGTGLLLPANALPEIARELNLFHGFDEAWCFTNRPVSPKPLNLSIVSPLNLQSDELPGPLRLWMKQSDCRLGLGDGIGLNYATPDVATAKRVEEFSLS